MNEKEFEKLFKALANRRRVAILQHLKKSGATSVGNIAEVIHLSFTSTSKHLRLLDAAGFVDQRQKSVIVYYMLVKKSDRLIRNLISLL